MFDPTARQVFTATPAEPVTIYYCKANLKTGNTVRIVQGRNVADCTGVHLTATPDGLFSAEMVHGNSKGKAKASGARCTLIVHHGIITQAAQYPGRLTEFTSFAVALHLFQEGKPIFVSHEQAEQEPIPVTSMDMLNHYSTGPFLTP